MDKTARIKHCENCYSCVTNYALPGEYDPVQGLTSCACGTLWYDDGCLDGIPTEACKARRVRLLERALELMSAATPMACIDCGLYKTCAREGVSEAVCYAQVRLSYLTRAAEELEEQHDD